ncbi:hypothetical protein CY652_11765 [Burkholderia sp. WAC0059]|uniref:DUF6878 family protein n=1 Tax=Burkholderia sp. WAC0059 TaxID=2066022 RepID=UPI000C7EF55C|nr:DUF6878 family protein [Burkholderia sp. WAC0059]PLZ02398.1 hypothetical protein CY652_11765 [Burkholderia sp. WAC0059]
MSERYPVDPVLLYNKAVLLTALQDAGAVSAVITYSGCDDNGGLTELLIADIDGNELPGAQIVLTMREYGGRIPHEYKSVYFITDDNSLYDALVEFAERAIALHHPGYENDQGGTGEIRFDCVTGEVRMSHNSYYIEAAHTEGGL